MCLYSQSPQAHNSIRRVPTSMLHLGRPCELAYVIMYSGRAQCHTVHAHAEYIKSLPLALQPSWSLLMNPATL